jgi:hypothetical protein
MQHATRQVTWRGGSGVGNAHRYLEAARNHVVSGNRETATLCLELAIGSIIEAREAGGLLSEVQSLLAGLNDGVERLAAITEPLEAHPDFIPLCNQLRHESQVLQGYMALLRYSYDEDRHD